jgi:hypothetical protein
MGTVLGDSSMLPNRFVHFQTLGWRSGIDRTWAMRS